MIYVGIYKYSNNMKFGITKDTNRRQKEIRHSNIKGINNSKSFEMLKVWDIENQYNYAQSLFIESYIRMRLDKLGFYLFGNDHFKGTRKIVSTIEQLYNEAISLL